MDRKLTFGASTNKRKMAFLSNMGMNFLPKCNVYKLVKKTTGKDEQRLKIMKQNF